MNNETPKSTQIEQAGLDDRPVSPRNPDLEKRVNEIYERNYFARTRKETLLALLNKEDFYEEGFREIVNSWNQNESKTRGFSGMKSEIERFRSPNGELLVGHYLETDSITFTFVSGQK